jgi:hypothetical protein
MSQPAPKRRGLVLAGGGAKGAYAFGCLIALKRLGISFDVVSGTSVGALNAALWSSDSMRRGIRIWRDISFGTTYPPKLLRPPVPRPLIWIMGAIFVCFQLARATLERRLNPATAVFSAIFATLLSITALALFAALTGKSPFSSREWAFWNIVLGVTGASAFYWRLSKQRNAWNEAGIVIIAAAFLGVYIGFAFPIGTAMWPGTGIGNPLRMLAIVAVGTIGCMLLALVLAAPIHLAVAALRASRRFLDSHTVLATSPLKELLQKTLTGKSWKCPTYATLATSREVFAADEWRDATHDEVAESLGVRAEELSRDFVKGILVPDTQRAWVPEYERVDGRPIDEAVDIILASAALPFGLVPHVTRKGERYVDGGIADNIPWFPTLDFQLDELIIVLLTPYESEASAISVLNVSAREWATRAGALLDFAAPIPTALFPEDIESLRRDNALLRSRRSTFPYEPFPVVRVLYPTRSLGGFLRGTMNFDGKYAEDLMRLGMTDTYARFRPSAI